MPLDVVFLNEQKPRLATFQPKIVRRGCSMWRKTTSNDISPLVEMSLDVVVLWPDAKQRIPNIANLRSGFFGNKNQTNGTLQYGKWCNKHFDQPYVVLTDVVKICWQYWCEISWQNTCKIMGGKKTPLRNSGGPITTTIFIRIVAKFYTRFINYYQFGFSNADQGVSYLGFA